MLQLDTWIKIWNKTYPLSEGPKQIKRWKFPEVEIKKKAAASCTIPSKLQEQRKAASCIISKLQEPNGFFYLFGILVLRSKH